MAIASGGRGGGRGGGPDQSAGREPQEHPVTPRWQRARPAFQRLPGPARLVSRWLAGLASLVLVAAAAIAVSLQVTPMQTVTFAGQVVKVGATAPAASVSGPGEVDLFGQSLPTNLNFTGPVRPRLQLARITINSQLLSVVQGASPASAERSLGSRLADGWTRYFGWETAITGLAALAVLGAVAGWRRLSHRATLKLLAAGLVVTEAINVGAIMITAQQAQRALRQVSSLNQLVGSTPPVPRLARSSVPTRDVQAVVLGDSTAAGAGLPADHSPDHQARTCGRSSDSYAQDLASVNGWRVLNLACDNATIVGGLLGPQHRHRHKIPPQLEAAAKAGPASVVIVSIGANDLGWASMVRLCALAPRCDDRATTAYFQQQLASFSKNYLELLSQLASLPGHPRVIINRYYNPFGPEQSCLRPAGLTAAKLSILSSRLATLNNVLAQGATQFGFTSPQPDFAGHQLCTSQPYVQWLNDPAPFHPTALGQLAIALTDQAALRM